MNKLSQDVRFRQALITYAQKYGVTAAAIRYKTNRQYVYRWLRRYDGSLSSLMYRSRRPHYHPNQHTEAELKLIFDMWRRNAHCGLVVFWVKLVQRGYARHISSLYRVLKRHSLVRTKLRNPKYVPKPYEKMKHPGQRIQIDVKFVPVSCVANGRKFYQYTAIDEYSRFRYLEAFDEHSQYNSTIFMLHVLERFNFNVECVQTDNGFEFTNRLNPLKSGLSMFEKLLAAKNIKYKVIRPFTPRHNGKVERSHRKDNEYFYASHRFYSLDDLRQQLAVHNRKYNNFPMRPLGWKSPKETLEIFFHTHTAINSTDSVTHV